MAEIEGTDDFQNMLARLKQRVNDIATVKANVAARDSGGDLKESITKFTETIQSGFAVLLDAKSAELERLGAMAAEAIAVKRVGDATAAELKKEITSALNTMGSTIETLSNTVKDMKYTVEQLKASASASASDRGDSSSVKAALESAVKGLVQEIKLTVGEVVGTRVDTAIAALKGGISAPGREPASAAPGMDFAKNYVETIRSEFNGEMREIKALIEKETQVVKSQTLEFLNFVTDKIVGLHGKVDRLTRPGGGAPSTVVSRPQPQPQDSAPVHIAGGGIDSNALQREIAPIKDGLVQIIRFLIALSKR